ncbi:MAG: LolA family protein, partial [Planctomycetota bacterium]
YKAVLIEGSQSERTWIENGSLKVRPYKSWAVANEDQTMIEKYRTEVEGFLILTTNGQKTWRYDPNTNTVRVENHPYVASEVWCGSKFLEQLKDARDKWILTKWEITYGRDPSTGKERAFLTFSMPEGPPSPRSLWIEFDMESKLLVSLKQWENPNWEGPPDLVVERITYFETLSDDLFEFEIPEGATVIEE